MIAALSIEKGLCRRQLHDSVEIRESPLRGGNWPRIPTFDGCSEVNFTLTRRGQL